MATGSNSRSDALANVTVKPALPGDCMSDKMTRELERRLTVTLPSQSQVGDSVVSRTPPEDKTKIWYLADENGVPTGQSFAYNPKTGQWESTSESIPPIPCLSTNTENIITTDTQGCWIVTKETITQLAQTVTVSISADPNNALVLGNDGGIYLNTSAICVSEDTPQFIDRDVDGCLRVIPSSEAGNAVTEGDDGRIMVILPKVLTAPVTLLAGANPSGSINLATFTTVPTWATHAIISQPSNQTFVPIASGFITHPSILAGESIILNGFIQAQP